MGYSEFKKKQIAGFDNYQEHKKDIDLILQYPDEMKDFLKYLKHEVISATAHPTAPAKAKHEGKKRGGHDKAKYPDGQYWGAKGKPKNAADAITRINDPETKGRTKIACANLLYPGAKGEFADQAEAVAYAAANPKPEAAKPSTPVAPTGEASNEPKYTRGQNGGWGKAGKPQSMAEAVERRKHRDLKPKIKKMLDNVIKEFTKLGVVPRDEKTKEFATTATQSFREEGSGDSIESPKTEAAA